MYVTMMMTDQIPLELPPLLNGEVAMMPHLVNGEAPQQVSEPQGSVWEMVEYLVYLGIQRPLLFELCCSREVFFCCCCTITILF